MLALLAVAELLAMSLWFTASAVSGHFRQAWDLTPAQTGALTGAVQLGFVAGAVIAGALNLADIVPVRVYFAVAALLAAAAKAAVVIAPGFAAPLAFRGLTGAFLAGVYPPAMKMAATWFRARRRLAIGIVVGALTVGKATPYLLEVLKRADWRAVILAASAGATLEGLAVAALYQDGPYAFPRRSFSIHLAGGVLRHRPSRLATLGYLGHMWELYACWTGLSLFFTEVFLRQQHHWAPAALLVPAATFGCIAVGGIGCVVAGSWGDRLNGARRIGISTLHPMGGVRRGPRPRLVEGARARRLPRQALPAII